MKSKPCRNYTSLCSLLSGIVLSILACSLLTACSVSDGGRTLVLVSNPFAKSRTFDACIDSPVQAYMDGLKCKVKFELTSNEANARLGAIRGHCALEYAINIEKIDIFEEFLEKGGKLSRCANYPSGIYASVAHVCRDNAALAHKFFDAIEKQRTYKDYPQVLLWHSTLLKCVEGVEIALGNGASPNQPSRKKWDDGLIGMQLYSPLEGAMLEGWRGNPEGMIKITNILIDAGASPWVVDLNGKSLFERTESQYFRSPQWQGIRAALLRAPRDSGKSK